MNSLELKGRWNIAKGKLKQKLAQLAHDHQAYAEGKENELLGRIQKRTGKARRDKSSGPNSRDDGMMGSGPTSWSPM